MKKKPTHVHHELVYIVEGHADELARVPLTTKLLVVAPRNSKGGRPSKAESVKCAAYAFTTEAFLMKQVAILRAMAAQRDIPSVFITVGEYDASFPINARNQLTGVMCLVDFCLLCERGILKRVREVSFAEIDS